MDCSRRRERKGIWENVKNMKKIISIIIIFIGLSSYSQVNKPFTPTKGEIVFKETLKITSNTLFDESFRIVKEKFKQSLKKSLLKNEANKDKNQQIDEMVEVSAIAMDDIYSKNYTTVCQYNFSQPREESFSENIILKIIEDRENKKLVDGYNCFKVTYQFQENKNNADEDYLMFAGNTIYQREMWVTEEIRSLYHPVVFDKSILEKYYPLDILETQSDIKGFERLFKLEILTAN